MEERRLSKILTDDCEIFFGKEKISDDEVLRQYIDFLTDGFFSKERRVLFALHTGSICFDVLSVLIASLSCIVHEIQIGATDNIDFNEGEIVVYKNVRYRWIGIEKNPFGDSNPGTYCKLQQDARGKNGPSNTFVKIENKNLIKPYNGSSIRTDGMGFRRKTSNREDFLSFLLGVSKSEIPAIINESVVIVCDRTYITEILKNTNIKYHGKCVWLEDLCPASYFTSTGEEYQIGVNQLKLEPILRITGNVSSARDLILDDIDNTVREFVVIGACSRTTEDTELVDLLNRMKLNSINISGIINLNLSEYAINHTERGSIFACTKEYLQHLNGGSDRNKKEGVIGELHAQEKNIIYSSIEDELVDGGWSWEEYKNIRTDLQSIKNSTWNEKQRNQFVLITYSLLNLLNTAPFSMEYMETEIAQKKINSSVVSPKKRIEELWDLADQAGNYQELCLYVIEQIEEQYSAEYSKNQKLNALKNYIKDFFTTNSEVAIVVPKAYYIDLLRPLMISYKSATLDIVTPTRLNLHKYYDGLLIVGNFKNRIFDPLTCKTAAEVVSFLYENEKKVYQYKRTQIEKIDHDLNIAVGLMPENPHKSEHNAEKENTEEIKFDKDLREIEESDEAIEKLSFCDLPDFRGSQVSSGGAQSTAEVSVIGSFISGETIFFTKYYKAVVYDLSSSRILEKDPDKIETGDTLVFMSRDSYTKNTVDTIYDQLLSRGKFNKQVIDATEKSQYWKECLREYKENNNLTYRSLAKMLQKYGSSIQEMAVRQWLAEDSHIVGPRDEKTMHQIARMTDDPYLSADPSAYFEACRLVRRERREILRLIGLAITEKLRGTIPKDNDILMEIWKNVDKLSDELEVDSISVLNEPLNLPTSLINKPIDKKENLL